MAVSLVFNEVSDLCIGKPALWSISASADTVADALAALRRHGGAFVSVWSCSHSAATHGGCHCLGKVCMADIVCFLCREENLSSPAAALQAPASVLLPEVPGLVGHLEPHASLLDAIDLMLEGAQNLVIPIHTKSRKKLLHKTAPASTSHDGKAYCWITREDIIRHLVNSIGLFSPIPNQSIDSLNIMDTESILAVHFEDPAKSILPLISKALLNQTSVAVVGEDGKLVGEISPLMFNCCDETASAAVLTLSAGDLMAYIDCGLPPEDLAQSVKERLEQRKMMGFLELMEEDSGMWSSASSTCSSSSDDENGYGRSGKTGGYSAKMVRRSETSVCYPWSSLVAVMIQALSHCVSYVWVVDGHGTLVGIVTFAGMLKAFREHLKSAGLA